VSDPDRWTAGFFYIGGSYRLLVLGDSSLAPQYKKTIQRLAIDVVFDGFHHVE